MTRQPTPANILDKVLAADVLPDRPALRARLRWDYSQVAPVDRRTVEEAAVDILANGQRMQESVVAIGDRLIAVKRLLDHGQFGDWCATEFDLSDRTAQNWMNIARTFAGKSAEISLLSDSALALLAAPSTPEPARQEAIQEAQATGKSPSVARTKEIIAQHRPSAISNQQSPISNPAPATIDVLPPSDAPLPSWAEEPTALPRGGDSRIERARHLIDLYLAVLATCEEAVEEEAAYESLVGTPSDLLAANRCMRQLPVALAEPIAKLRHLIAIIQHPEEAPPDA